MFRAYGFVLVCVCVCFFFFFFFRPDFGLRVKWRV